MALRCKNEQPSTAMYLIHLPSFCLTIFLSDSHMARHNGVSLSIAEEEREEEEEEEEDEDEDDWDDDDGSLYSSEHYDSYYDHYDHEFDSDDDYGLGNIYTCLCFSL